MKRYITTILLCALVSLSWAKIINPVVWNLTTELSDNVLTVTYAASIKEGFHLYAMNLGTTDVQQTEFTFEVTEGVTPVGEPREVLGKAITQYDERIGRDLSFYEDTVRFEQKFKVSGDWKLEGFVFYMSCNDRMCTPPTREEFAYKAADFAPDPVAAKPAKKAAEKSPVAETPAAPAAKSEKAEVAATPVATALPAAPESAPSADTVAAKAEEPAPVAASEPMAQPAAASAERPQDSSLLSREAILCFWIALFLFLGLYLLGFIRLTQRDTERKRVSVLRLVLALLAFALVFYLLPGLWGAPCRPFSKVVPSIETQDFRLGTEQPAAPHVEI